MKNLLYSIAAFLVSNLVLGQTDTENYIISTTYQVKTTDGQKKRDTGLFLGEDDKIESISYVDGLGRAKQNIAKQAGGNKQDIITPVVYDPLGRQIFEYLPYANKSQEVGSTSLDYRLNNIITDQIKLLYTAKFPEDISLSFPNPYSEKKVENSALNRIMEQGAPGKDWRIGGSNSVRFRYEVNSTIDSVKHFKVIHNEGSGEEITIDSTGFNSEIIGLYYKGFYNDHNLYKNITKDENYVSGKNHTTEEYIDRQGRVILKRNFNENQSLDTYYVYDRFGNLTYVLSPEGSLHILEGSTINEQVLNDLCYQYRYDYRNRLVEKKVPGKGWEYIVYDKLNRPILTQDANLRSKNTWLFTKYDVFGREAYTGFFYDTGERSNLQNDANDHLSNPWGRLFEERTNKRATEIALDPTTNLYYSNVAFPINPSKILTINYYDDYDWDTKNVLEASYDLAQPLNGLFQKFNTIKKINATAGWNSGFKTIATIQHDGYIQFTAQQTDKRLMIGLTKETSAINDHYNTIGYAIYIGEGTNKIVKVYEEGISQTIALTYFDIGDVFRVERSGHQIFYIKNDVIFHSSLISSTDKLVGDSSFYDPEALVSNVFIGYSSLGQLFTSVAKSLHTGSKVRVLDTDKWITTVRYYDNKARPILETYKNEYLNISNLIRSQLDFIGNPIKTTTTHNRTDPTSRRTPAIVTLDKFTYDHTGRLLRHIQKINANPEELIFKNNYDELGQLIQKKVGGQLPNTGIYINVINIAVSENIITKLETSSNNWGNAGLATHHTLSGDGYISFKTTEVSKKYMVGLSYNDTDQHYNSINYAIFISENGLVKVYENGIDKGGLSSHTPGDEFFVERRGTTIYYLKNGKPFYTSQTQSSAASMLGDVSIYSTQTHIKDLLMVDLEKKLQEVDYLYNIRGWLKGINQVTNLGHKLFGYKLNYNTTDNLNATALYNGNISETYWKTINDNTTHSYYYQYDALNRLNNAVSDSNNRYGLEDVIYDQNGNIKGLKRKGHIVENPVSTNTSHFGTMDLLTYIYKPLSNQLLKVSDASGSIYGFKDDVQHPIPDTSNDYSYDDNGNMIMDANKGITSISYNHLNLPTSIIVGMDNIQYVYDATGVKQKKMVSTELNTEYAGNYVYQGGKLKFFNHPEGYIEPNTLTGFDYVYQYKDHLGNVRLSYSDADLNGAIDPSTEIIEEHNYYPFGLQHKGYNNVVNGQENNYQTYQGQEDEKELGKNTYAFQWRDYDPAIARFNKIDRFAEKYAGISPYAFSANNPIRYREVAGDSIKLAVITRGANNEAVTQNLYWGQDANGNNGFIDVASGNVYQGNDQLVADVTGALNSLINGGNTGSTLVNDLASDQNNSVQIIGTNGGNGADENSGNWVRWNSANVNGPPDNDPTNNNQRPSFIGLGHELSHVRDVWNGGADQTAWYNYTDANGNNQSIPRAEIYSTHIENQLRSENNLPLRTNYSVDPKGNPTGPNILFPGTRQSRYYDSNGNNNANYRTIRRRKQTPFSY